MATLAAERRSHRGCRSDRRRWRFRYPGTTAGKRRITKREYDLLGRVKHFKIGVHSFSIARAMPWPPPMHSVTMPRLASPRWMACSSLVASTAPLAPIGCPWAIAPPSTLTTSSAKPQLVNFRPAPTHTGSGSGLAAAWQATGTAIARCRDQYPGALPASRSL